MQLHCKMFSSFSPRQWPISAECNKKKNLMSFGLQKQPLESWQFSHWPRYGLLLRRGGGWRFIFSALAIVRLFGIEANVQTIKEGLLRHHSACFSSLRQWALPTRCPSDEPDPLLKDSDFTRSQTMCSRSFIRPSADAYAPPTHHVNESQSFLDFTIRCFVFGQWSIAYGTLCRIVCDAFKGSMLSFMHFFLTPDF